MYTNLYRLYGKLRSDTQHNNILYYYGNTESCTAMHCTIYIIIWVWITRGLRFSRSWLCSGVYIVIVLLWTSYNIIIIETELRQISIITGRYSRNFDYLYWTRVPTHIKNFTARRGYPRHRHRWTWH